MKKTTYFVLNIALFLSLMGLSSFAHGQTQAGEQPQRLVVSFYSICCGINHKAQEKLDRFIKRYEKTKRKQLTKAAVRWGREGEIDYCLKLSELSPREQKRFISQVRLLLKRSKLVHINENVACQSGR
ncbi:MAG: hypothetical protein WCF57_14490 [Pyrinomonadaceae bacterium]